MNEELKNILQRVRCLYMKYGIKSVTMDDIARELGISKKTLYQYVQDKTELVAHIVEMELNEKEHCFESINYTNLNAIEELFELHKIVDQILKEYSPTSFYDLKKYYPEQHDKIIKIRRETMYSHILKNLKKGKEEGLYRFDLNEEMIAKMQILRIETFFDNEFFTPEEMTSKALFFEMFNYHIRGIASEKGLKVLEKEIEKLKINNN